VDNRGAGQTILNEGASFTIEDMADDIAAIMDANQLGRAHILGVSMGGAIALVFALRHPDKVQSLIAAVTFAVTERPNRAEFLLRTGREMRERDVPRDILNRFNATFLLGEDVFKIEPFIEVWVNAPPDPLEMGRDGFERQLHALDAFDIREQLKTITAPTLVVSSPDDLLVPPRYQDEIARLIPNSEMKRYPGGHVFMALPMYSPAFVADVLAFWEKHATSD
jgi:pimeloyl-ACP methyl ester carboxylesterase